MTLDPVHFDGIARLARRIEHQVDDADHADLAETAWDRFLDPLRQDGRVVLEPIDGLRRQRIAPEEAALRADDFPTRHGLDSGTINPRTFRNGLVIDVAQAAMAATPSTLDLHRARTVVATVHSNDVTVHLEDEWDHFDEGFSRGRVIHAPRVDRYENAVVHALSLYLAESSHALHHAESVDELLVLDGPLYPTGMMDWLDCHPELAALLSDEALPRTVVRNYLRLVERFSERDVPLVGFVKNVSSAAVRRALHGAMDSAPWVNDAAFFAQVLGRREDHGDLAVTNWFVSRGGTDRVFAADTDGIGLDRKLLPVAYEVTYCVIYDARTDEVYKIEAPHAVTRDADRRERLTRQFLTAVAAARGPPRVIGKADALARIGTGERESLVAAIERTFGADRVGSHDERRWGMGGSLRGA